MGIRLADKDDIPKILLCLANLSPIKENYEELEKVWDERDRCGIFTFVYEEPLYSMPELCDLHENVVIGTASIHFLPKLSRGGSTVAIIEDVSVMNGWEYKGIGTELVNACIDYCGNLLSPPYKIILDCKEDLETYYKKFGFKKSGIQMRLDVHD